MSVVFSKDYLKNAECIVEEKSELVPKPQGCPCILQTGKNKGQRCGKNISENGHCKIHQKKCIEPQTVPIQPLIQPDIELRCPCILQSGKNKGQPCGKDLIAGTTHCRFHQKKCLERVPQSPTVIPPVDEPIEETNDPVEEVSDPVPIIEEEILREEQWKTFTVSEEELERILSNIQITSVDAMQFEHLEQEIQKCFGVRVA